MRKKRELWALTVSNDEIWSLLKEFEIPWRTSKDSDLRLEDDGDFPEQLLL